MTDSKNTPELRFPGFKEPWEAKKGKNIFSTKSIKGYSNLEVLSSTQDKGVVYRKDLDMSLSYDKNNLNSYKKVSMSDFIISLRSFQGGIECSNLEGIMSPAYTIFNFKDKTLYSKTFFSTLFKSNDFINLLNTLTYGVRDGKSISYKDFSSIKFNIPSLAEQEKIGSFFSSLDKKLDLQKDRLEELKSYKKGMMQRIFDQEIRFKDENGRNYPDWQEKKLGEVAEIIDGDRGKNYPNKNELKDEEYCLFLSAQNVTSNGFEFNSNNKFISKDKDDSLRAGKMVRNDIVITTRGTIGNIAIYDKEIKYNNLRINSGMIIIRSRKLSSCFLYFSLRTNSFKRTLSIITFGSAQPQLAKKDLLKIKINVPSLPEQEKIASFLSALDRKIELEEEKLRSYEEFKKGLMQRMFV